MQELLIPKWWTPIKKLLALHAMAGGKLTEKTATGNPATFTATAAKPLIQCQAAFVPVQSGSGDPSPENVRPITGWTGVNVYHSGEDTNNPTAYPVAFPAEAGTVYGGYVDLVTGVLTVEWKEIDLGDCTYSLPSGNNVDTASYSDVIKKIASLADIGEIISTEYKTYSRDNLTDGGIAIAVNGAIAIQDTRVNGKTKEEVKELFTGIKVCFALETPVTYQLTPIQITTLIGTNNLWSDANGNITVKYLTKGA